MKESLILATLFSIICCSCISDSKEATRNSFCQNSDSLSNVASKLFWDGKLDSSLILYDMLVINDSLNPDYFFQRGAVKFGKKDVAGALNDLNISLSLKPENTQAIYYKALVYEQMSFNDSSNYLFNYLISLKPDSIFYLAERAKYYERHDDFELALIDWNTSIKIVPNNSELYNNRGVVYVHLKRYNEAIKDFDFSIKLKPSEMNLINRSQAYYYSGKYESSLRDIEEAIKINTNNSESYLQRAGIRYHLRNEIGACEDFKKSAEMGNQEAIQYYNECVTKGIIKK